MTRGWLCSGAGRVLHPAERTAGHEKDGTEHDNDGGGGRGSEVRSDCVRAHGHAKLTVEQQLRAIRSTTICSDASCGEQGYNGDMTGEQSSWPWRLSGLEGKSD